MEKNQIFSYLKERFGLSRKIFDRIEFFERSKGRVFAVSKGASDHLNSVKPVTAGLLFARVHGSVKPTSNIIQLFGSKATKNILSLEKEQAKQFIQGFDLDVSDFQGCTDGYVIVKYNDFPLGVGLLKSSTIKNMLNKAKRINVEIL